MAGRIVSREMKLPNFPRLPALFSDPRIHIDDRIEKADE
jgi:hypothetical protein